MNWNKLKKQLETFLSPAVADHISYSSTGYRYTPEKKNQSYILVEKTEILNTRNKDANIKWYENEQEVKEDKTFVLPVTQEEVDQVRVNSGGKIPEERLMVIARNQKLNKYAKNVIQAQSNLFKSDFTKVASEYLKTPVDTCLKSDDILLNILALLDRRLGKNRLVKLEEAYSMKHPAVKYFYNMRRYR